MWGGSLGVARGARPGRPAGSAVPGAGVSTPSDVQGTLMVAVARGGPHLSAPAGGGCPKRFARESAPGSCRSGSGPERRGCRATVSGHRASAGTDTSLRPQPGSRLTLDDAETFPSVRRRLGLGAFGGAVPTAVEGPGLQLSKAQDAPSTPPREGAGPKAPSEGTSGEPRRAAGRLGHTSPGAPGSRMRFSGRGTRRNRQPRVQVRSAANILEEKRREMKSRLFSPPGGGRGRSF